MNNRTPEPSKISKKSEMDRRKFIERTATVAALVGSSTVAGNVFARQTPPNSKETVMSQDADAPNRGKIFKSVKWGMIRSEGTILEKFLEQKELGYDGIELVGPDMVDVTEVAQASLKSGMPVHGLVNMKHWDKNFRLSLADESKRDAGRKALESCLRDAKAFGGDTVLLVPGRVSGPAETHDDVWNRSIAEIKKTLPLASQLGVRILIENVWNGFCEKPEQLRDYLDEINSPWVGSYFDIGNVRKFGPSEDWIRALGNRIVKLDVKDWGKKNGFCKIGDGDVNWPEVCKALDEIQFTGWCTAEVGGGKRERLADIATRMNRCLGL